MNLSLRAGVEQFAPAKVNLTLRVGRARADGYHPLDSLVVFADWGDTLVAEPADDLTLAIEGIAPGRCRTSRTIWCSRPPGRCGPPQDGVSWARA